MHIGPLGQLRRITPLKAADSSPTRSGGVHTALSGARTVDHLGARRTWQLAWKALPPGSELTWLEALYYRHVPGPLRLLLPAELQPNRLSRAAASVTRGGREPAGLALSDGIVQPSALWPAQADPPGRSAVWRGWTTGDTATVGAEPVPVLPGETVTASVWVRSVAADEVRLDVDHHTADSIGAGVAGPVVTLTPDTWTRLTVSTTPPGDVVGVRPVVAIVSAVAGTPEVALAAAQVEAGDTAGVWHQGGGAPAVSVDTLATSHPFSPLTRPSMTLLEL